MIKTFKRFTAFLLALVLCISMIPLAVFAEETGNETVSTEEAVLTVDNESASAHAEDEDSAEEEQEPPNAEENIDGGELAAVRTTVSSSNGPRRAKGTQETGRLRVLYYTMDPDYTTQTTTMGELCGVPAHSIIMADGKTQKAAYCLNQERGATEGYSYTWKDAEESGQSDVIGTICALGYQYIGQPTGSPPTPWGKGENNDRWLCTQLLVWAATNGYVKLGSDHLISIDPAVDADMAKVTPRAYNPTGFSSYYATLKAKLLNFRKIPSFASYPAEKGLSATAAKTITLKWDGEQYSATATDRNGVLDNYNFRNALPGVEITMSGNTMTLTSPEEINEPKSSSAVTYRPQGGRNALAYWTPTNGDTSQQDFAVFTEGYDPVSAILTVRTGGEITKPAGLVKTSEDGIVSGITFTISGSDGKSYVKTTDSAGQIDIEGLPVYKQEPLLDDSGEQMIDEITGEGLTQNGDAIVYTVTEQTPIRYVIPQSQTFTLTDGEAELHFNNRLKKWNVAVTKSDRETGSRAQGDATLTGAVYGIYHNGVLQDQYSTDSTGKFTSKWYPCGTGWTLKEIRPSTGYLLNETSVSVGLAPENTTIEYNATSKGVVEQVIKGQLSIVKHTDDGDTQIETPETGAEFQIYLTASGSFNNARTTERDTITIDEAGYGISKLLPYGKYTVHQTKGWEGKEKITDFQVFICEDGKTYPFIINNREFESYVEIVKRDITTGRTIPASGIGFKIKDLTSGKWVSQHINYPTPQDIVVFYTDVTGKLMLPDTLGYGTYALYEQVSAYGYVLAKEPVEFKIDGTYKTVTVELSNTPQMGQVTLRKSGEVFSSVSRSGDFYQPVYNVTGLSGAVYSMYAEEDISTLDGTLRYATGQLIEQVETNAEGEASFPAVFLGKYKVVETRAPIGYVRDTTEYHVELSYAGQEVSLVTEKLELSDQRQKVRIDLAKRMEQEDTFKLGTNGEIEKVRFNLYAAEKLTARDGRTIPADGLIETVEIEADGTAAFTSDLPFGCYYIREAVTEEHYILDGKKYPVTFSYTGQQTALVKIRANDEQEIENKLKRGTVSGRKVGEDGDALSGVLFGLFPADTEEFSADNTYMTVLSENDGTFAFADVPYGKYLVKELETLPGYVLLAEPFPVEITEDGQAVELSDLVNEHTKVSISKQSITGTDELPGAALKIFTSDGELIEEWVSTEDPHLIERLPVGSYVLHEVTAPNGYLVAEDVTFTVEATGEIQPVVMKDRPRPVYYPRYGALKIVKTSEDGIIEGRTFRITGPGFDENLTTDKYGEIGMENLTPGEYIVSEVTGENMEQYVIPESQTVTVKADETVAVTFHNRLKRGSIAGQKTDVDGKALAGVLFGLFPADTEEFSAESAYMQARSGKDGSFSFENVLYGKYLLKELKTLSGYVLLDDSIPVEITKDGQTVKLPAIVNKLIETKTDIPNTGEKKNIAVAGLVLILCIIGAAALFLHERRRRKK